MTNYRLANISQDEDLTSNQCKDQVYWNHLFIEPQSWDPQKEDSARDARNMTDCRLEKISQDEDLTSKQFKDQVYQNQSYHKINIYKNEYSATDAMNMSDYRLEDIS